MRVCVVCVYVNECMHVCVRACVCACVRACVRVCVCIITKLSDLITITSITKS